MWPAPWPPLTLESPTPPQAAAVDSQSHSLRSVPREVHLVPASTSRPTELREKPVLTALSGLKLRWSLQNTMSAFHLCGGPRARGSDLHQQAQNSCPWHSQDTTVFLPTRAAEVHRGHTAQAESVSQLSWAKRYTVPGGELKMLPKVLTVQWP